MRYLPVSIDTRNKTVLIIGGGKVAYRKCKTFLETDFQIDLISKDFCEELVELHDKNRYRINITQEVVDGSLDLTSYDYLIIATNNKSLNSHIEEKCKAIIMPYLRCDDSSDSTFIMNKIISKGDIVVSVSLGGKNPTITDIIGTEIAENLEKYDPEKIEILNSVRSELVKSKTENVSKIIKELFFKDKIVIEKYLEEITFMKKVFKIGSRGSNLALIQANQIKDNLKKAFPDIDFEIVIIKTYGDKVLDLPLDKLNDKGVFVKEIEKALLEKEIDIAVHSMKDMPSEITPGLTFTNPPKGEDPSDVLILKNPISSLEELKGAKIGSGSKRRKYQLENIIPEVDVVPIRGNIETRMSKIESENLDGVILAKAGIIRAGYENRIGYVLDSTEFLPSPCQGILALQIREDDIQTKNLLSSLEDENTTYRYETERAYQKEIGAGCHSPVGVYAIVEDELINIYGFYGDSDGDELVYDFISGPIYERVELATTLAKRIKEALHG